MKILKLLLGGLVLINLSLNAQDIVIAGWTFPGSSAVADTGLVINLENEITTMGGTSDIEFKNGFETKAAQATEWNNGMDTKAWQVYLNAEGYENLTISSLQSSGGNDPGPKDFKTQYSIDNGTSWIDVENGDIIVENDWEAGVLENVLMPENSFNQPQLMIRWIMASNEASGAGGQVLESGKSKIDEIYIRGDKINATGEYYTSIQIDIFPNPATNYIDIQSNSIMQNISIIDITGKVIYRKKVNTHTDQIVISNISKGYYFINIQSKEGQNRSTQKLLIR